MHTVNSFILYFIFLAGTLAICFVARADINFENYHPVEEESPYRWCTMFYFNQGKEIIVDLKNSRILFRNAGTKQFKASRLPLLNPHSLVYNATDKLYYVADTDNNRILSFDSLENSEISASTSTIDGIELNRPHDIVYDQDQGWLYAINPLSAVVFRFKAIGVQESSLDLSAHLGYSRALTFRNGKLFVIGSSRGKIVEITDFEKGVFKIYQSPGKKEIDRKGCWQRTGLVLNDIEYFNMYWYASSYFTPSAAGFGQDYNKNKLIRFKTWEEFEKGEWEDLSPSIPDALVPYFLTVHENYLYIPLYNHDDPGENDCIYRISPNISNSSN